MEIWSNKLVEELAFRRAIIFFGSGVSAVAKRKDGSSPVTWGEFIKNIKTIVRNASTEELQYIDDRLDKQDYLSALQAICDKCDSGDYAKYLRDTYGSSANNGYVEKPAHEMIRNIDCKIVITTNFDKIYESCCPPEGYVTLSYDKPKAIIDNVKSPANLLIKAHGTIDEVNDIIFTAKQYYDAQEKHPEFYEVLSSLFMTHTVLFLGYSLSDPDINLVLQLLHKTASASAPHYLALPKGTPEQRKRFWKDTYNVEIIEYGESHDDFLPALEKLDECVQSLRQDRKMS